MQKITLWSLIVLGSVVLNVASLAACSCGMNQESSTASQDISDSNAVLLEDELTEDQDLVV